MNKIIKNALILAAITLIAGLLLGAAHQVTLEPIQKQQEKEKQEKLEAAMDRLRGKFGTDVISYGAARPEKEEDPLP